MINLYNVYSNIDTEKIFNIFSGGCLRAKIKAWHTRLIYYHSSAVAKKLS
ncbi:MAG: hypothetical protein LBU68_02965 [Rickettsiales bacterium]|jgi:hypothetical protein|nr:hypothetical protein [Rickettsiales bacterium]